MLVIPALLPVLPKMMQVNFMQLGFALAVFGVVSALVQAPIGFLVDKWGAKSLLKGALFLGGLSYLLLALMPSYPVLILAMALSGLANGVYHPADYALLSKGMPRERMGRAFSIHTFSGYLGAALAPPITIAISFTLDVRWAFAFAALLGFLVWALLQLRSFEIAPINVGLAKEGKPVVEVRPLRLPVFTLGVLTLLFMLLSLSTGSIEKFSVTALVEGFNTPLTLANQALTGFLFASAFGVLFGGYLADKTTKHGFLAALTFGLAAVLVLLVIYLPLAGFVLVGTLTLIGFLTGVVAPSRDMLVRAAAPEGSEGKVFGIVSTGFNFGAIAGPLLFGWLVDKQLATGVFWASFSFMVATSLLVLAQEIKPTRKKPYPC
ncbi:MAG: MFS transporter [Pseudomonadaceae bacterium]|nr:MFS transporter [Pseudomonadaceae bacterium]